MTTVKNLSSHCYLKFRKDYYPRISMHKLDLKTEQLVDSVFQEHIEIIKKIISEYFDEHSITVFLYGSYGRGEGGWFLETKSSLPKPYNDYDIAIISKNLLDKDKIRQVEKKLLELIPIQWIDISQYSLTELKSLKPTIKNFDLKYASKFIMGNQLVLEIIPSFKPEDISPNDIDVLFNTRIFTLIGSFGPEGLVEMSESEERFFRNQMSKCILSIVDCILLINKAYESSYVSRVNKLNLFTDDKDLINKSNWAIEEKLNPKCIRMTKEEIIELYSFTSNTFFKYFFLGLSHSWSKKVLEVEDIRSYFLYSPKNLIIRIFFYIIGRGKERDRDISLVLLQVYIAFYFFEEVPSVTSYINKELKRLFSVSEALSFNQARVRISEIRSSL